MTGEEIARELISTLSVQYSIPTDMLLAAMHDRASTNNVALRTLKVVYPNVIDIGCISHTLNIVGEKFQVPNLSEFMTWWVSLFSHSPKARMVWRAQTGRPMPGYSPTRWWSKWELMKQIMELFGDVESFLRGNEDLAPATRGKLLTYFDDTRKTICLKIEMAIIVDVGSHFVKATYALEGDGPLALTCYETISALTNAVSQGHYPNAQAVIKSITADATQQIQLMQYATSCIQPGLDYFANCKENSVKEPLACFKAARLFSPTKVEQMKPSVAEVNKLAVFPFLSSANVDALKAEFPAYLAAAEDIDQDYQSLEFWRRHKNTLPTWTASLSKVLLVQPSSAASERVFSILKQSFGDQQTKLLQDYVEASLMLQFNKH